MLRSGGFRISDFGFRISDLTSRSQYPPPGTHSWRGAVADDLVARARDLLQAQLGEGGGAALEADRDALVIGDHRQAVLPAQTTQPPHLVGLAAEVDLSVNHPPQIEIRTQRRTVGTPIGGKDDDGVERGQLTYPHIAN